MLLQKVHGGAQCTHMGWHTTMIAHKNWRTEGSNTFQEGNPNHALRTMSTGGPAISWSPEADSTNARVALPCPLYTSQNRILCPGLNSRNLPPTTGNHNPCLCKRAAAFSVSNHSWGTDNKSAPILLANAGKSSRAFGLQDGGTDGDRHHCPGKMMAI